MKKKKAMKKVNALRLESRKLPAIAENFSYVDLYKTITALCIMERYSLVYKLSKATIKDLRSTR